jgi:hypothetical protein
MPSPGWGKSAGQGHPLTAPFHCRGFQPGDDAQKRGLAAARRDQQAEDVAFVYTEADVVGEVGISVGFGEVMDLK